MEKIDKAIEIFQAFKEGKIIEYESCKGWQNFTGSAWNLLQCISNIKNFRVKQQPTYRPYVSSEEFLKASKEHGPHLGNNANYYIPIHVWNNGIDVSFDSATTARSNFNSFKELLDRFHWQDGTPCGILEQ